MGKGFQGAMLRALGAKNTAAVVTGVRWITDHVVRIDFQCDDILHADGEKPSAWVRAWFPDVSAPSKFHQRGYTLLDPDPAAGTFSLCFLVHDPAGPASTWARTAAAGDQLLMTRLGGDGHDVAPADDSPLGYLLMGDVASWPAFVTLVERVPAGVPIRAVIEYCNDDDRDLPLPDHDGLTVDWVPSTPDRRALVNAIGGGDYRGWRTWVTAESKATRLAKGILALEHEQNKATMHTQAYWMAGRAMGKQVDTSQEARPAGADTDRPTTDRPNALRETAGAVVAELPSFRTTGAAEPAEPVLKPARPAMLLAGLFALILALLAVVPLILFAELARLLVAGADRQALLDLGVVAAAVLVVGTVGSATMITALHFYDQVFAAALRRRVVDKLTRLPLGWFLGRRSAEVKLVKTTCRRCTTS